MTRKQLNHNIRALAHGTLGLTEDEYRTIAAAVDPRSEGHITKCDDEHANLVYMRLKKMASTSQSQTHAQERQHRMIARLMEYLRWTWGDTASFCLRVTGHRTTKQCSAAELSKVIRGMVSIIDQDVEKGKIQLTHTEKFEYERHVKHHRQTRKEES